jgi:hypothetical protein
MSFRCRGRYRFYLYSRQGVVIQFCMRYTIHMRSNSSARPSLLSSSVVINKGQRTIPFLPGLVVLGLGVVLLVAPRLVLGALAFCLLTLGIFLCYVAYKFVSLRKQLNSLAKSMESSLYTGSFRTTKPEGDVIEIESGKIVYH